ncbi:TPA: hypothetical protein ACXJQO_000516 [Serratia marcescens]|uniref:hypothetical protein n=3 Tax=Serratia TaxID=613 RepID=UPI00117AD8C2|nr:MULTISPECIES: hypothetical protein [Serratia]CAI0981653.1 Uncharacterised protein [Serratia marcescens]
MKRFYDETLRWMIAIFFIAVPFNPYISGMTFYLWIILIFADTTFLSRMQKVSRKTIAFLFIWMAVCLITINPTIAIKSAVLALGIFYFVTMRNEISRKVYFCFLISLVWCLMQFAAFFVDKSLALAMGPKNLSQLIWGQFATKTSSNQFAIILFPRMSGLSREAGFFASLLAVVFLIRLREGNVKKKEYALFAAGFLCSLSKVSFSLLIIGILYPLKRIINKIPVTITYAVFFLSLVSFATYLNIGDPNFYIPNESIAHRLSASYMIQYMDVKSLFLGCADDYNCFDNSKMGMVNYLISRGGGAGFTPNVGLNGIFINLGVLGFITAAIGLQVMNFKSFDLILLIIFTSTVSLFTIDGFVIAIYYYILTEKYYAKRKSPGESLNTWVNAPISK